MCGAQFWSLTLRFGPTLFWHTLALEVLFACVCVRTHARVDGSSFVLRNISVLHSSLALVF